MTVSLSLTLCRNWRFECFWLNLFVSRRALEMKATRGLKLKHKFMVVANIITCERKKCRFFFCWNKTAMWCWVSFSFLFFRGETLMNHIVVNVFIIKKVANLTRHPAHMCWSLSLDSFNSIASMHKFWCLHYLLLSTALEAAAKETCELNKEITSFTRVALKHFTSHRNEIKRVKSRVGDVCD